MLYIHVFQKFADTPEFSPYFESVYKYNKILLSVKASNGAKVCSVIRAKCKENGRQGDCENAFPRIQECQFEYPVNQSGKYLFSTFDSLFLNQHTDKAYYINYTQQDY
jgi:hypothetical protein